MSERRKVVLFQFYYKYFYFFAVMIMGKYLYLNTYSSQIMLQPVTLFTMWFGDAAIQIDWSDRSVRDTQRIQKGPKTLWHSLVIHAHCCYVHCCWLACTPTWNRGVQWCYTEYWGEQNRFYSAFFLEGGGVTRQLLIRSCLCSLRHCSVPEVPTQLTLSCDQNVFPLL